MPDPTRSDPPAGGTSDKRTDNAGEASTSTAAAAVPEIKTAADAGPKDKTPANAGPKDKTPANAGPKDKTPANAGPKDKTGPNDKDAAPEDKAAVGATAIDLDKAPPTVATGGARVTRILRHASPMVAARKTVAWARRPVGRVVLPAVLGLLLLAGAGTAGAILVPKALKSGPAPSASPGFPLAAGPPGPAPTAGDPAGVLPSAAMTPGAPIAGTGRPADALAGWAQQVGTRAGIPVVAVEAYGYAELVLSKTAPACHLSWTTIAAIGYVESDHGSFNNSVLNADGTVRPPIFGLPLDGKGGRQLIADTDKGAIDGDTQFDRAVGPLQFIPSTWVRYGIDADNNGVIDPNDIDDAALAAGNYLCAGGRDLSKADAWYDAILSYNAVGPYAAKVFQYANFYGQRSRL